MSILLCQHTKRCFRMKFKRKLVQQKSIKKFIRRKQSKLQKLKRILLPQYKPHLKKRRNPSPSSRKSKKVRKFTLFPCLPRRKTSNSSQTSLNAKKLDLNFDTDDFFDSLTQPTQPVAVNKTTLVETKSEANPFAVAHDAVKKQKSSTNDSERDAFV